MRVTVILFMLLFAGLAVAGRALADADAGADGGSDAGAVLAPVVAPAAPAVKPAASPSVWEQLKHFYFAYAPWILGSLIPSMIVGLSQSPKTKGLADRLKWLLGFLSLVTHADSPGTFKLPLVPVRAPDKPEDASKDSSAK